MQRSTRLKLVKQTGFVYIENVVFMKRRQFGRKNVFCPVLNDRSVDSSRLAAHSLRKKRRKIYVTRDIEIVVVVVVVVVVLVAVVVVIVIVVVIVVIEK